MASFNKGNLPTLSNVVQLEFEKKESEMLGNSLDPSDSFY